MARGRPRTTALGAAALALACTLSHAGPALDAGQALDASQAAIGRTVSDVALLDRDGQPLSLARYRGKPLLVSFVYTGCFRECPTGTRSLYEAVQAANASLGPDGYQVVSIGFNQPADSPQAMKAFAAQQRIDLPNWDFLSAPAPVVERLTRDFGFVYAPTAGGFEHVLQVTLVDAQGRIVRQIYGDRPDTGAVVEPLGQLLRNAPLPAVSRWSELVDRVRLMCSVYDPQTGTYRTRYGLVIEIAGGLTFVVAMLWFFLQEWRARRRWRQSAP